MAKPNNNKDKQYDSKERKEELRKESKQSKNRSRGGSGNASGKGFSAKKSGEDKASAGASSRANLFPEDHLLVKDAARISMHNNLGLPLYLNSYMKGTGEKPAPDSTIGTMIPGIMAFDVIPTYGWSRDWNSALNVAARKIYTFVRHVNSGKTNYDAANLMMYLLMMDNAFMFHMTLVRVYGFMQTIMLRNRYLPKTLIRSLGFDYEDLARNMSDFRAYINMFAVRLNSMAVPNAMPIYQRHAAMFSSVYADSDSDKCQLYVYRPAIRWFFSKDEQKYGLFGERVNYSDPPLSTFRIKEIGDRIINSLVQEEDWNIMSGDILHAYGAENLVKLGLIDDNLMLVPEFNREKLLEIHNTTVMLPCSIDAAGSANFSIYENREVDDPNAGALIADYNLFLTGHDDNSVASVDRVIDMMDFEPSPANVMLATRMAAIASIDEEAGNGNLDCMGSEIVCMATVYQGTATDGTPMRGSTGVPSMWYFFDWAPIWYYTREHEGGKFSVTFAGSITNASVVSKQSLTNMHSVALLRLFGVA
uniref:Capsid protein n=1 Tax=Grey teal picobirnavirus Z TaxID=2592490 RepID=A0A5B8KH08_9VIRU|nr:capsid protein [Grey teal picobirnavirus Z]